MTIFDDFWPIFGQNSGFLGSEVQNSRIFGPNPEKSKIRTISSNEIKVNWEIPKIGGFWTRFYMKKPFKCSKKRSIFGRGVVKMTLNPLTFFSKRPIFPLFSEGFGKKPDFRISGKSRIFTHFWRFLAIFSHFWPFLANFHQKSPIFSYFWSFLAVLAYFHLFLAKSSNLRKNGVNSEKLTLAKVANTK